MNPISLNPQTEAVARRVIWFEPPAQALADPIRFMADVMAHATPSDLRALRPYVSEADFQEAWDYAPPGIIDRRSWAYWNRRAGRFPTPPMPVRRFA